jgi:hypothetical protein
VEKLTKEEIQTLLNIMRSVTIKYKSKESEILDVIYEKLENILKE